jgi:hypothetical protein
MQLPFSLSPFFDRNSSVKSIYMSIIVNILSLSIVDLRLDFERQQANQNNPILIVFFIAILEMF